MNRLKSLFKLLLMLAAALASFSLAVQWSRSAGSDRMSMIEPIQRSERMSSSAAPSSPALPPARERPLQLPERLRQVPQVQGDAFATLSWQPLAAAAGALPAALPRPAPPPPPAAPVAPVLPFTFVGLIQKNGVPLQAFLTKAEALLVVAAGDLIDSNTYRVESLTQQQIVFTYLPLNTTQTLELSGNPK